MTKEEIIRIAREAGFVIDEASRQHQPKCIGFTHYLIDDELSRFAALVAAAERDACAKVCEAMRPTEQEFDQRFYTACTLNANAIRNRGNGD